MTATAPTVYPQGLNKERFACRCGCCRPFDMDQGLIDAIRAAQVHFRAAGSGLFASFAKEAGDLIITSGFRCQDHNAKVGGVEGSHHMRGRAVDFIIMGVPPQALADFMQAIIGHRAGIGVKPASGKHTGFVHVDLRGPPGARWTYKGSHPGKEPTWQP